MKIDNFFALFFVLSFVCWFLAIWMPFFQVQLTTTGFLFFVLTVLLAGKEL